MSLKDALTNSLLMFVAATCVVLIVKALPQGSQQQQVAANTNIDSNAEKPSSISTFAMQDGVKVYYLHGKTRCPTCRTIEEYAKEAVETGFADEIKNKSVAWQVIDYETPGNEHYATDYEVVAPNVVLAKYKGGKQIAWKGLPEVWEHVGDKAAFVDFVQKNLREFHKNESGNDSSTIPPVKSNTPDPQPVAVPLPE